MPVFIFGIIGIISLSSMCTALYATYDEMFRIIAIAGVGLLVATLGLHYAFDADTAATVPPHIITT